MTLGGDFHKVSVSPRYDYEGQTHKDVSMLLVISMNAKRAEGVAKERGEIPFSFR